MKYLIYFLLFSTAVFSQNYQYALEEATVKLPEMPSGLVASQITDTSADLKWIAPAARLSISSYGIYSTNSLLAKSQGSGTNYKLSGLIPDTAYTLTVRAIDDQGSISADSNAQTFRTKKSALDPILAPPVSLIVSEITDNSAFLTWTAPEANDLITEYGIYSKNVLLGKVIGTILSYKIDGLTPETLYTLSVRSMDVNGNMSVDSELQTFTTKSTVTQPILIAPSTLIATQVTDNSALLVWVAPADKSSITDYGIYNNNVFLAKSIGTNTTYKVTGLTPEKAYSLTVRSLDKVGNISVDSNVLTFTTTKVPAPSSLIPNEITENSVVLNWSAPAAATSVTDYGIYNNNVFVAKSIGTTTTYKVTGLTPETAYTLTVRSLDKAGNMSLDSNSQTFTTSKIVIASGVNNQLEEIEYFKAYLLPVAQKATIQAALDKYGSVRLEAGNYYAVNIIMRSNQRLYGDPSFTLVPDITIAAGSKNVYLQDLTIIDGSNIILQGGAAISGCTFKSIKNGTLLGNNVMFENNTLIDYGGPIRIDCSQSGYIRNNKIIKHQSGTVSNLLVMKGNKNTPSYGNAHLHTNFLTPHGDTTELDGLQSATFIGVDAEAWNLNGLGKKAMFYAQNVGDIKLATIGGGNAYSAIRTPAFDISANNVFFLNAFNSTPASILTPETNLFGINSGGDGEKIIRKPGAITGFELYGNLNGNNLFTYNGITQTSAIENAQVSSTLTNFIRGKKFTPWVRPNWELIPDPLGVNWRKEREGKPDNTSYIQNLIDTKGIAELPEGVFYIKSTLKVPVDRNHGITGKGTGKTVIVGMTDDFPLISLLGGQDDNFVLAYLTLQGGSTGIYASQDFGKQHISYQKLKFVVFRNQKYGIHLKNMMGFDNNFLDNLSFVECKIGFFQDALTTSNNIDFSSFVDKTMFYKNQFINCDTSVSLVTTRADNMNAWVDCKFDRGQTALSIGGQNGPIVANCDFSNFNGKNVIIGNNINIHNTNIYNNNVTESTIQCIFSNIEGCNFMDNSKVFSPVLYNPSFQYIINSRMVGDVTLPKATGGYYAASSIYVNSLFSANLSLSKLLVNVKEGVPTILLNSEPDPYPQFLVTQ